VTVLVQQQEGYLAVQKLFQLQFWELIQPIETHKNLVDKKLKNNKSCNKISHKNTYEITASFVISSIKDTVCFCV